MHVHVVTAGLDRTGHVMTSTSLTMARGVSWV